MAELRIITIAFVHQGNGNMCTGGIIELFQRFETIRVQNSNLLYKRIGGKLMRLHAYEWPDLNEDFVVVPFGTLKETDKPMGLNAQTQRLEDIQLDMFDVNCLAYHSRYNVALLTINKPGPSMKNIEDYLNQFFTTDFPYRVQLNSTVKDTRLERMRDSREIRELEVKLDLGRPLNQFFREQVVERQGLAAALGGLITASRNQLASKTFTLALGLGRAQNETMDLEAMLELLDEINLDDDSISEISVKYIDRRTERVDTAYAKNCNVSLKIPFDFAGRPSAEVLKHNIEELLRGNRNKYYEQVRNQFEGAELMRVDYELIRRELD